MVNTRCQYCNCRFLVKKSELDRGNGKFCSISCSNAARKRPQKPNAVCAWCNEHFYLKPSRRHNSRSGLFFCCRACKDAAQRIGGIKEIQPPHYGSTLQDYRAIAFRTYPARCNHCGYDTEPKILQVHHRNHVHADNFPDNLEILCPNCHALEHL